MTTEQRVLFITDSSQQLLSIGSNSPECDVSLVTINGQSERALRKSLRNDLYLAILLDYERCALALDELTQIMDEERSELPLVILFSSLAEAEATRITLAKADDYLYLHDASRIGFVARAAARRKRSEVAAHKALSQALVQKQKMESIVGNILDVITIVDIKGTIMYESPSLERVLGYKPEDLLGVNAFSLIHPLDIPKVMPIFMLAIATPGVPHSTQFRFKHLNGSWRQLEVVGLCTNDPDEGIRIIVTSRDITDRSRAESALGESELRFKTVIEGLGEGLVIMDLEDRMLYANRRLTLMTGFGVHDLLGRKASETLIPPDLREGYGTWCRKLLGGDSEELEIEIMKSSGERIWSHIHFTPYRNTEGIIAGTMAAVTDITERKHAEIELRHAKEKAEEMSRLKTAFLANMSHEIRTPMTSILGFASILGEHLADDDLAEFAKSIERSGSRLMDTLNSILELARLESANVTLEPREVDLVTEVAAVVEELSPLAQAKGLYCRFTADRQNIQSVTDPNSFRQIVRNIVRNGIKFTNSGGITVEVSTELMTNTVSVSVTDTGIGISKDFLPHIFDAFKQESAGWTRNFEGSGVGLTVANQLLELLGGHITVNSEEGLGSTFKVSLPLVAQGSRTRMPGFTVPAPNVASRI